MPASFGGSLIFGRQVSITPGNIERETQSNAFMGVDGMETIDGGYRQRMTVARGRLFGLQSAGGLADLVAAVELFESYRDGLGYVLIDTAGRTFNNVRLEDFSLDPKGYTTTPFDYFWTYTATFRHLSAT